MLALLAQGFVRPRDLARETRMRPNHVSRDLKRLARGHLVERLGYGYRLTTEGLSLLRGIKDEGPKAAPSVRGSHIGLVVDYLRLLRDRNRVKGILLDLGLEEPIAPDEWYPLVIAVRFLEAVEREFGDGTYQLVSELASQVVPNLRSVRSLLGRTFSIEELRWIASDIYLREFNHGQIDIKVEASQILISVHHWLTSPARCAAWVGALKGVLRMLGLKGIVRETSCSLVQGGDCRYQVLLSTPSMFLLPATSIAAATGPLPEVRSAKTDLPGQNRAGNNVSKPSDLLINASRWERSWVAGDSGRPQGR